DRDERVREDATDGCVRPKFFEPAHALGACLFFLPPRAMGWGGTVPPEVVGVKENRALDSATEGGSGYPEAKGPNQTTLFLDGRVGVAVACSAARRLCSQPTRSERHMRRFHAARFVPAILLLLASSAWASHRTTGSVHVHGYTTGSGHYV